MLVINFFIVYFLLLAFGGIICTGWHSITRGFEKTLPDGSKKKVGKLFKGWYFFWFQKKEVLRIHYSGDALFAIFSKFRPYYSGIYKPFISCVGHEGCSNMSMLVDYTFLDAIPLLRSTFDINFIVKVGNDKGEYIVFVYGEEPVYRFPEWLRDPLAGCVTCYASIYGSVIFWTFYALAKTSSLGDVCQLWVEMMYSGTVFLVWVAYCISLAFVNTTLWIKSGQ